jgi:hypothetical protein
MIISSQVRIDDDGKSASIVYLTSTEQPLVLSMTRAVLERLDYQAVRELKRVPIRPRKES